MKTQTVIVLAAIAVGIAASLFALREALLISRVLKADTSLDVAGRADPAPDQSAVSYARCVGEEIKRYPAITSDDSVAEREFYIRLSELENRVSYYTAAGGLVDFCSDKGLAQTCRVKVQPLRVTIVSASGNSVAYVFSLDRKTGELEYAWFPLDDGASKEQFTGACEPADAPSFDTSGNVL